MHRLNRLFPFWSSITYHQWFLWWEEILLVRILVYSALRQQYLLYKQYHILRCLISWTEVCYYRRWRSSKYVMTLEAVQYCGHEVFSKCKHHLKLQLLPPLPLTTALSESMPLSSARYDSFFAIVWTLLCQHLSLGAVFGAWSWVYRTEPCPDEVESHNDHSQVEGQGIQLWAKSAGISTQACLHWIYKFQMRIGIMPSNSKREVECDVPSPVTPQLQ